MGSEKKRRERQKEKESQTASKQKHPQALQILKGNRSTPSGSSNFQIDTISRLLISNRV